MMFEMIFVSLVIGSMVFGTVLLLLMFIISLIESPRETLSICGLFVLMGIIITIVGRIIIWVFG